MYKTYDLVIVGGGPAGLSAAINAASEGLEVCILDAGTNLGGQAKESSAIENYAGFPDSVTGADLMDLCIQQANKFKTHIHCPVQATSLEGFFDRSKDSNDKLLKITTTTYEEYIGHTVLLAAGLSYRTHPAHGLGRLMRRGVYYGVPDNLRLPKKCNLIVVGGGNSAGQAAMWLARNPNAEVKIFTRSALDKTMSQYLIERITAQKNIEVCIGCEVSSVEGRDWLQTVHYMKPRASGAQESASINAAFMFVFIGAIPQTAWLKNVIALDEKKFILTGPTFTEGALQFETSLPGVFAAGDIRADSTKRIAAAIGEGSSCVAMIHRYLAQK